MADRLDETRALDEPHRSRLDPDDPGYRAVVSAHRGAMARGESGYLDPRTGLFVFTAPYLANRGTCCDTDCRHCPYVGPGPGSPSDGS